MAWATLESLWMSGVICHLMTILESPIKQKTENCVSVDPPKFEDSGRVPETCVNLIFGGRGGGSLTHKGFPSMVTNGAVSISFHTYDLPPVDSATQWGQVLTLWLMWSWKIGILLWGFVEGLSVGLFSPVSSETLLSQLAFLGKQTLNFTGETYPRKIFSFLAIH